MSKTAKAAEIESEELVPKTETRSGVKKKQIITTLIKTVISASLIYWILRGTNFSEIFGALKSANVPIIILVFFLHLLGLFISVMRWRLLMSAQGVQTKLGFLLQSYIIAMFVNHLLPSTFGGDTVRAYDSYRVGKSKSEAVAVVFVDRFLGFFALVLYAIVALFFATEITSKIPYLTLWVFVGFSGMALIIWLTFMPSQKLVDFIGSIRFPFSAKIQKLINRIIQAFWKFRGQKKVLLKALGLSLILQLNVIFSYFLISIALDFNIAFYNFFLIVPLSIFIMMLPISIYGIGLRENAFFFFLSVYGVLKPQAIAFAWIEYGIMLFQGVLGGIVYAFRK